MRKVAAVIAGALVGSVVFFLVGLIANAINPTPPELMDPTTPEAVARRVASTTTMTWLTVILGLALGAFVGGVVGVKVAKDRAVGVTGTISALFSIWALYTFYVVFPAVLWVPLTMLIAALLFPHLGGLALARFQPGERRSAE